MTDYIRKASSFPSGAHWAILSFQQISQSDGYDGYSTETINRYYAFTDEKAWTATIEQFQMEALRSPHGRSFVAFHVDQRARITMKVEIAK